MDDLDDLLSGVEAAEHVLADGALLHRRDEIAGDLEVDVGLEQRQADLAHRLRDRLLVEAPLTAEIAERDLKPAGEHVEHGRGSVRTERRHSAPSADRRTLGRWPICDVRRGERRSRRVLPRLRQRPPDRSTPAIEIRKTVTILFCDVVGSTSLGEKTDPETTRRVMSRYADEMGEMVRRHGGTVERFRGDEVMAVFGVPTVHEDDALRAVRAAKAMQRRLAALNEELVTTVGGAAEMPDRDQHRRGRRRGPGHGRVLRHG